MSAGYVWGVIAAMALANYATRFIPMALLSRVRLPRPVQRWLSFIPVSVMAALVVSEVLMPDGRWLPPLHNPYLAAAVPTALIYRKWRSLLGTAIAGVLLFLVFRAMLG